MNDPIADMMTRIRNAGMAQHSTTRIPHSKMKVRLAEILKDEGFINDFSVEDLDKLKKEIIVHLRYGAGNRAAFNSIKRISKSGCRVYKGADELPKIKNGLGISIVSTSKGVVTDKEARRLKVGGEVLCEIW